jgi:hypothetical protein
MGEALSSILPFACLVVGSPLKRLRRITKPSASPRLRVIILFPSLRLSVFA